MTASNLTKEVLKAIRERLEAIGFRKRTGEIYTCPLQGDVFGWIGLQRASQPGGAVAIIPTIGVHNSVVEHLVHEFDEASKSGVTATLARPLGYLFPKPGWREWEYSSEKSFRPVMNDMIGAITRFGIPYMHANADPDVAVGELANIPGRPPLEGPKRIAIMHALQGKADDALTALRPLYLQIDNWSTGRTESLKFLENFGRYFHFNVFDSD